MRFAQKEGERIFPNPLEKNAFCPLCNSLVIAKCGEIKIWHWTHKSNNLCDSFKEPETQWHLKWKNEFQGNWQEIIIEKEGKKHIADVFTSNKIVIEFQNSPISSEAIKEREDFYGKMKWVLNGETYGKNIKFFSKKGYISFKWNWFPKSWSYSNREIYIDMNFKYKQALKKFLKISNKNDEDSFEEVVKGTYWEEDADGDSYPKTECYTIPIKYGDEKEKLRSEMKKYENKLFLIKKLSDEGTGWGKLISKEVFIKECEDGYYRNQ